MLVISQVFNNNVALVRLDDDKRAIVMGKGIAYNKRKDDIVDNQKIQEIFYLDTPELQRSFQSVFKNVPIDIVTTVFSIIEMVNNEYNYQTYNYIYITLCDHVYEAYKKLINGSYQESPSPDIHDRYPFEYRLAEIALRNINQELHVHFPKSEIKNIALHFINAKSATREPKVDYEIGSNVSKIVQEILTTHGIIRTQKLGNYYDRLMIHLQYLAERLEQNKVDEEVLSEKIENDLEQSYPESFRIANDVCHELEDRLRIHLNVNERAYFIIHIQRLINETAQ